MKGMKMQGPILTITSAGRSLEGSLKQPTEEKPRPNALKNRAQEILVNS